MLRKANVVAIFLLINFLTQNTRAAVCPYEDSQFYCGLPDSYCIPLLFQCDGKTECALSSEDEENCPARSDLECPDPFEFLENSHSNLCYYKNVSLGLFTFNEAKNFCDNMSVGNSRLVRPNSIEHVEELGSFLGVEDSVPGFWIAYTRRIEAPLDSDGTLSPANHAIRANKFLYVDAYAPDRFFVDYDPANPFILSLATWRDGQPGDILDERDERCVAKKKPNNHRFKGVDDFPCEGARDHYAICEIAPNLKA